MLTWDSAAPTQSALVGFVGQTMSSIPESFHAPAWAAPPLPGIPLYVHEIRSGEILACHDISAIGKALVTIGRSSSCDVHLDSKSLSRTHAVFVIGEDGRVAIADLGSKKGSSADGTKLSPLKIHNLRVGAIITVGDCSRRLLVSDERTPALPARFRPAAVLHSEAKPVDTTPDLASSSAAPTGIAVSVPQSTIAKDSASLPVSTPASSSSSSAPSEPASSKLRAWLSDPEAAASTPEMLGVPLSHVAELCGHTKTITGLVIDTAGARVTTASNDCSVRLWDLHAMDAALGSFRTVEPKDIQPIASLSASPSGAMLLLTDGSHQPRVLDREGNKRVLFAAGDPYVRDVRNTRGHTAAATCGAWHPTNENCVLTAGVDGAARLWDIGAAERVESLKSGHGPGPGSRKSKLVRGRVKQTMAKVNPFGELFCGQVLSAASGASRTATRKQPPANLAKGTVTTAAAAASSSGVSSRSSAIVDDLDTAGRRRRRGQPAMMMPTTSAASAAETAATAGFGVDAGGGRARPPVTSLAWSPDGRHAVLGVASGSVQLWDTRSNMALPALRRDDAHAPGMLSFVGYAPGGTGYCLGSRSSGDDCVRLWDVRAIRKDPILALSGVHTRSPWANVCWAADKKALVLGTGRGASGDDPTPLWVVGLSATETAYREVISTSATTSITASSAALDVESTACGALCSWGSAGSELVVWHESLGQLFVGCGDGIVRGVWSESLSRRGLRDAVGKGLRSSGVVVADAPATVSSASMQIFNPNALPLYRDESGPFARKRGRPAGGMLEGKPAPSAFSERHPDKEDPEAERKARLAAARIGTEAMGPEPLLGDRDADGAVAALRPGRGAGGVVAPDKSLAQWSRQKDLVPGSERFKDPREELLKFAGAEKFYTRAEGHVPLAEETLEHDVDADEAVAAAAKETNGGAKRAKPGEI